MPPKKKKEEEFDISQLPPINRLVSSMILSFVNKTRRTTILESLYKSDSPILRPVFREELVQMAKEKNYFEESEETPLPSPEQLAKAAIDLILERSIPAMRQKHETLKQIEEMTKLKEEATEYWKDREPDPKKKDKKAPPMPEDVEIPVMEEDTTNLILTFINYPLSKEEYSAFSEGNILNYLFLLKEGDELIEVEEPVETETKGKKKEKKPTNEELLLQKYFEEPEKEGIQLYEELSLSKLQAEKTSNQKFTVNEVCQFFFEEDEETKENNLTSFPSMFLQKGDELSQKFLKFEKWLKKYYFQQIDSDTFFSANAFEQVFELVKLKNKNLASVSYGTLILILKDEIKHQLQPNKAVQGNENTGMDIDGIFEAFEKKLAVDIANSTKTGFEKKEIEGKQENEETPDKTVINDSDFIFKKVINNTLNDEAIVEQEKNILFFRNYPGIDRYLMPEVPTKEANRRKAEKCQIIPFLTVPVEEYNKFNTLLNFETTLNEKIDEQNFDFGDRVYTEIFDSDVLSQVLNKEMLLDKEILGFYEEKEDNYYLVSYYRYPKGRIFRKHRKYRYLSKPDFQKWIQKFEPALEESIPEEEEERSQSAKEEAEPKESEPKKSEVKETDPKKTEPKETEQKQSEPEKTEEQEAEEVEEQEEQEEQAIPHDPMLYEATDEKVGEVYERTKFMFPADNGVFVVKEIRSGSVGLMKMNYLEKDNLMISLKKTDAAKEMAVRFENDTLMTVSYAGEYDNSMENEDLRNGCSTVFTLQNGLTVTILPNGDVQQHYQRFGNTEASEEQKRILTGKASLIKYFNMERKEILFSNGNISNIGNGLLINTNNRGHRVAKDLSSGKKFTMDSIPTTIQSDPESNSDSLISQDNGAER